MPANLTPGLKYAIKVQGEGGVNFSNYTTVDFNPKYSSIMIQTDKAIYKPGQTSMYSAPLILYNSSINKFFFHLFTSLFSFSPFPCLWNVP